MRKLFLILMTLCAVTWSAMAQTRHISGTVVDAANNEPLIGATVMPIGGGQGAATDVDGNFSLDVPSNVKQLKVSYVGYKEQTVPVSNNMTIHMASSSTNLDDVVVVAYGTANKESLTGSVAVVGAKEIEERPVTTVTSALEGSAPGVQVNNSASQPGSAPNIHIRGYNSFDSSAQGPLYVVDGLVFNGTIADLNPADVESMSVLKDAASCALYGSRGANGVILITTKKAKGNGRVDVSLTMNWGAYELAMPLYSRLGANKWMEMTLAGMANGIVTSGKGEVSYADAILQQKDKLISSTYLLGTNPYGIVNADGVLVPAQDNEIFDENGKIAAGVRLMPQYNDLNWWKAMTRTGSRQEYNLNAAGATDKFDVFGSMGYLMQNGYVINSDFKRFTGRLNANFYPVSYFKAGMNLSASYSEGSQANVSSSSLNSTINPFQTMFYSPVQPIYEHDAETGEILRNADGSKIFSASGLCGNGNLLQATKLNRNDNNNLTVDGSIYGTAILPYGFEATVRGGMFRQRVKFLNYMNNQEGASKPVNGTLVNEFDHDYSYTFSQAVNWSHEYGAHHVDVLLHHENFHEQGGYTYVSAKDQKIDGNLTLGNFNEVTTNIESIYGYNTESYLGRARYNYEQKYFAEFSLNRDGSSQFAKDKRWGTFWSVGASWIITKEKFMHNVDWLNYLKLRAAYGSVGNNKACSYYNYLTLFGYTTQGNLALNQLAAPDLRWEATKTLDVALEGSLFNDRFSFSVGFFDKRNSDLIFSVVKPWSGGTTGNGGYNPSILTNIGEMQNYGWELQFGVDIIRNANVTWDFNVDASFITNKIKSLPDGKDMTASAYFIGKSRYENYVVEWAGTDMLNGRSLYAMNPQSPDFYSYDSNNKKVYNQTLWDEYLANAKASGAYVEVDGKPYTYNPDYAGRKIMSSKLPVVFGSFGTNVSWKGIRAGLLFTYSIGGKILDNNYRSLMGLGNQATALHKDVLKSWTAAPEGLDPNSADRINKNQVPQLNSVHNTYQTYSSSQYLTNASYLTLKNVNVSYDLPAKWVNAMKLQNINIGFMMENAFIASARRGFNPQAGVGSLGSADAYFQPSRTYTFQLSVKF